MRGVTAHRSSAPPRAFLPKTDASGSWPGTRRTQHFLRWQLPPPRKGVGRPTSRGVPVRPRAWSTVRRHCRPHRRLGGGPNGIRRGGRLSEHSLSRTTQMAHRRGSPRNARFPNHCPLRSKRRSHCWWRLSPKDRDGRPLAVRNPLEREVSGSPRYGGLGR